MNEKMNHLGTAIIVLIGSLLAYALYPNIGLLFVVSPIACAGVLYYLRQIQPGDIDHNAARGLDTSKKSESGVDSSNNAIQGQPSFNFGFGSEEPNNDNNSSRAETPLQVLKDPILLLFILI